MTPQVQIWVHLDSGENAASLAVKLQGLIRKARQQGLKAFGFIIWTDEGKKEALKKLAAEKKINDIALCYLPTKKKQAFLKLYKIQLSDDLRNIIFVYRKKKLFAKFLNLNAKDFSKVEKAFQEMVGKRWGSP